MQRQVGRRWQKGCGGWSVPDASIPVANHAVLDVQRLATRQACGVRWRRIARQFGRRAACQCLVGNEEPSTEEQHEHQTAADETTQLNRRIPTKAHHYDSAATADREPEQSQRANTWPRTSRTTAIRQACCCRREAVWNVATRAGALASAYWSTSSLKKGAPASASNAMKVSHRPVTSKGGELGAAAPSREAASKMAPREGQCTSRTTTQPVSRCSPPCSRRCRSSHSCTSSRCTRTEMPSGVGISVSVRPGPRSAAWSPHL